MRYTASTDVLAANLAEEAVLLHLVSKRYYRLNATAAVLWKELERGGERDALIDRLTREFEVEPATAAIEVDRIIAELEDRDLITVQQPSS